MPMIEIRVGAYDKDGNYTRLTVRVPEIFSQKDACRAATTAWGREAVRVTFN
mgnify:CR=1 FL=1